MDDPKVAALKAVLSTNNMWDDASTLLVVVGVVIDFAALFWFNKDMPRRERVILACANILIAIGCAGEFIYGPKAREAESQLQQISDQKVASLARDEAADNKIATQAAEDAGALGVSVGTLGDFVKRTEGTATAQRNQLENFVKRQGVEMAAAVTTVKTDAANMTIALNKEKDIRDRLAKMVIPRDFNDADVNNIVSKLKSFPGTEVVFTIVGDNESLLFVERIMDAVIAAGWKVDPWRSGGFVIILFNRPELPPVGQEVTRGIQLNVNEGDKGNRIANAALALNNSLSELGFLVKTIEQPNKLSNGMLNPSAVKAGTIRIAVGTKE